VTINARILFVLLAGLLLAGPVCSAQQNLERRIDRYIKGEMRRQKIPGISLAVLRRGKIAILRSYGLANVEHNIHVKPETVFQSGSIGKQFTAAGVMLLVQDGKLSLDDRITQYFPDAPETWQKITIRNMLNGTSGLGGFGDEVDLRRDYTEEQFLAFAKKSPLSFEPGTNWAYSNIAYVTLGILIHKITGKFYGDFLRDRIFRPLGMTTARIISEADIVPNRAAGYRLEGGEIKNQEWVSPSNNSTADGSLYLTIIDLAKWDAALYTDFPIKQSTLRQIYTPTTLPGGAERPYGFGWHIEKVSGRTFAFHGGAWQGFKSFIGRFPEDKLTVIFFANSWETRDFKLARGLVSIFYPQLKLPPIEPIADEDEKVTQTIRRTLLQLSRSQADAEQQFTLASRTQFFPAKAKLIGSQLASLSIPVAVIFMSELVGHRTDGTRTFYDYLLTDYTKSFLCTVEMTEGKVADIELSPR
jgi:CubicO group peptidase (beta-lactamase class C family)